MTTTEFLVKVMQYLLSLSLVIGAHWLGHFIPGKLFKVRFESSYLFFYPWISFFKKEKPSSPSGFDAKPAWQRLIIMLGGVTMNLILAFFIYVLLSWTGKETYLPTKNLTYGIVVDSLAESIGLQDGDMILGVNNAPVENFRKIPGEIILREATSIQVARDHKPVEIEIPQGFMMKMIRSKSTIMDVRVPVSIDTVAPNLAADQAGFRKGDQLLTIDGKGAFYYHEFKRLAKLYTGQTVPAQVLRAGDTVQLTVKIPDSGILGFHVVDPTRLFEFATIDHTFLESISLGWEKLTSTVSRYGEQLWLIVTPKVVHRDESLGGFIVVGKLFPAEWSWIVFLECTALLSSIMAFINMLPIPPLDGGSVPFLLYEMVTRHQPGRKFMKYVYIAGLVGLVCLIFYAG